MLGSSLVAAVLVFRRLGTKPLWLDEAVSVSVAGRPITRILAVLPHRDANAGLYYLVLHWWLRFGHGAAWDRGLSAVSFVATAGLAAWAGVRWRGAWLGACAGLLVATNRFLLFYGQEARPYAPAVLLAVASTAALVWRDGEPSPRAYVVTTALLLCTDLFAVLFVAAQAAAVLFARRGAGLAVLRRCWLAIAAVTAPVWVLMATVEHGQIGWLGRPTLGYLGGTVSGMGGGWLGLALMVALGAGGTAAVARRGPRRDRWLAAALWASFVGPPVGLWLFSRLVPSFVDRYVICSTVALVALASLGLTVVRRAAGVGLLAVLVAVGLGRVAALERAPYKYEDPPAVVAYIRSMMRPGDAIGFGSGGLRTVLDLAAGPGALPADIALAPGGQAWRQDDAYAREVGPGQLAARLAGVTRLWLVTDPSDHGFPSSGPFAALAGAYRPSRVVAFPGMDVALVSAPATSPTRAVSDPRCRTACRPAAG